jgi:hypothetical protein
MKQTQEFSDRDLDALFDGREVSDERLQDVALAFSAMRSVLVRPLSDEHAAAMGAQLAAATPPVDAGAAPPRRAARWRRRLTAIGATATIAVVAVGGSAAANGAAPGDALYGIDRALERVGLLDGGVGERLTEAAHLAAKGENERALVHAAEAYETDAEPELASALLIAADAVRKGDGAGDGNESVAGMLEWMATADRGEGFGQQVSAWARGLGVHRADDASPDGSQTQVPAKRPPGVENAPGAGVGVKPGTVGPTDNAGPPDHAGQPGGVGKPDGGDSAVETPDGSTPGDGDPVAPGGNSNSKPDHAGTPGKPDHAGTPGKPDHAGKPGKSGNEP